MVSRTKALEFSAGKVFFVRLSARFAAGGKTPGNRLSARQRARMENIDIPSFEKSEEGLCLFYGGKRVFFSVAAAGCDIFCSLAVLY